MNWWPVDRLIAGYLAISAVLVFFWRGAIPHAGALLAAHVAGIALIALAVKRPGPVSFVFRHWYPLPYVASCYKVMSLLIPPVRGRDFDPELARLDYAIWGVHPTVWLERIQSPWLTEVMQALYSLFVPAVLAVAFILWRKRRYEAFRRYAFLIALGFLVSYAGYLVVPARGPRFLLAGLQRIPLHGLWLYETLRVTLDRLESAHYDCFPSGHTELTILAWWGSRQIGRGLARAYFVYTLSIFFATVYLRYHYTVDVMAGVAVAAALIATAPFLFRVLEGTLPWDKSRSFRLQTGRQESSS